MSKIIEKRFNPENKISRTVFKGSPNLFTTSDLNRQIESLKYQLDTLEKRSSILSDLTIEWSLSAGKLSILCEYSYLEYGGCSFKPTIPALNTNLTFSAPVAYLCLTAEVDEVTYDMDSTHEIAGATFEDKSSYPSANQLVYKNENVILTHTLSVDNLVCVLAKIRFNGDTENPEDEVMLSQNTIVKDEFMLLRLDSQIQQLRSSIYRKTFPRASLLNSAGVALGALEYTISNGVLTILNETRLSVKVVEAYKRNFRIVGLFSESASEYIVNHLGANIDFQGNEYLGSESSTYQYWTPIAELCTAHFGYKYSNVSVSENPTMGIAHLVVAILYSDTKRIIPCLGVYIEGLTSWDVDTNGFYKGFTPSNRVCEFPNLSNDVSAVFPISVFKVKME